MSFDNMIKIVELLVTASRLIQKSKGLGSPDLQWVLRTICDEMDGDTHYSTVFIDKYISAGHFELSETGNSMIEVVLVSDEDVSVLQGGNILRTEVVS